MLEFSPAWDARWCYLVVLICAVISAYSQIYGRLNILKEKVIYSWSLSFTWLIFSIYLSIPLVLFWFLDRVNAINDTSLFAALLVGLAYPALLSGSTNIKAVPGLIGVFDWLNKITDSLVTRTLQRVALRGQIFERAMVDFLEQNPAPLEDVKDLALRYADSRDDFIQQFDQAATARAKAQVAFDAVTGSAEGLRPLSRILPKLTPAPAIRSPYTDATRWAALYALLAFFMAAIVGVSAFTIGHERYVLWRMIKPANTGWDLKATRNSLWETLNSGRTNQLRERLIELLQTPALEPQRADQIIQLVIATRGKPNEGEFSRTAILLTEALRFTPVDIRVRIQHGLLSLAAEKRPGFLSDSNHFIITKWTPIATESLIDLEDKIRAWNLCWAEPASQ